MAVAVGHAIFDLTITHIRNVYCAECCYSPSLPADETVIAMYYHSRSEIAALIIKQKADVFFLKKGGKLSRGFHCPLVLDFTAVTGMQIKKKKKYKRQPYIFDLVAAEWQRVKLVGD